MSGTHLDNPVGFPEVAEPLKPLVYLLHLDADHVPEPGQVLASGDEGVLLPGDVLKYEDHQFSVGSQYINMCQMIYADARKYKI